MLYTGKNGMVAHECIIDLQRRSMSACDITVEDVAKRLVDFGFHAPTMSFPVGFCDAMIQIRQEIAEIESGQADSQDNLLRNAPHTHHLLLKGDWTKPYTKEQAFFPLAALREDKYWPPVGRIDNVCR